VNTFQRSTYELTVMLSSFSHFIACHVLWSNTSSHVCWDGMQDRAAILALHARSMPLAEGVDLAQMAADCRGFTGADLAALCREAAMHALSAADAAGEGPTHRPFPSRPCS